MTQKHKDRMGDLLQLITPMLRYAADAPDKDSARFTPIIALCRAIPEDLSQTSPEVVRIIRLIAALGFGRPYNQAELLRSIADLSAFLHELTDTVYEPMKRR
jgi:hypothetical protein